ncbi:MAG: energy-coupling factor transporter transmembrane protein EcfT [Actinobacteria bacterium]|nr:energy-coupling factor transporter transmembrane protein EcfT [Actinomycetota bacterium]
MTPAYESRCTYLHSVNPLVQVLFIVSLATVSLATDNPVMQIAVIAACMIVAIAADVFKGWVSWCKVCVYVSLFALLINPLVSRQGATVLWLGPHLPVFGRLDITLEAVIYGAGMGLKLSALIMCFALLSLIVDPDRILGLLRGRGSRSALLIALSLKMVPNSMQDAGSILDAMRSRGIALDDGGRYKVMKSRIPLVSKLVSTGLDRAIDLAEAMESRAYGSALRTRFQEYGLKAGDTLLLLLSATAVSLCIAGIISGVFTFTYYPKLSWSATAAGIAVLLTPVIFSLVLFILSWSWRKWTWLKLRI